MGYFREVANYLKFLRFKSGTSFIKPLVPSLHLFQKFWLTFALHIPFCEMATYKSDRYIISHHMKGRWIIT